MLYRDYVDTHGHGKVPKKEKDGLGRWLGSQRSALKRGKLSYERFKRLEEVEFAWSGKDFIDETLSETLHMMRKRVKKEKKEKADARLKGLRT